MASGVQKIDLLYFARLAELTGRRHEEWPLAREMRGSELLAALEARYPDLGPASRLKLAVNQFHARPDVLIQPGDEVAVFEPVTGG